MSVTEKCRQAIKEEVYQNAAMSLLVLSELKPIGQLKLNLIVWKHNFFLYQITFSLQSLIATATITVKLSVWWQSLA